MCYGLTSHTPLLLLTPRGYHNTGTYPGMGWTATTLYCNTIFLSRLRPNVLASCHLTLLHHFVYSVFIHTHLTSSPLPSPPHNLPSSHQHNHHLHRLKLCSRLLQVLKVCGHIEEPSLCLQAVVMSYGLLAPLLQRDIRTPFIAEVRKNTHQHSHLVAIT